MTFIANGIRDAFSSPQQIEVRNAAKVILSMTIIAAAVAAVASVVFAIASPGFGTAFFAVGVCLAANDLIIMSANILEVLNNAILELRISGNAEAQAQQVFKNTIIGKLFRLA